MPTLLENMKEYFYDILHRQYFLKVNKLYKAQTTIPINATILNLNFMSISFAELNLPQHLAA